MDIKYGYPILVPSAYSIYISNFGDDVLTALKKGKQEARYHGDIREYEVTPTFFETIRYLEEVNELNELPDRRYTPFKYRKDYQYRYQEDAVEFMRTTNSALINFSQGMGKANINGTIVKTPRGDTKIENLQIGDFVFGDNGKPARVSAIYPHTQLEAYALTFKDGSRTECLDNHIWTFYDADKKENFNVSMKELLKKFRKDGNIENWQLPKILPLEYKEKELPTKPYTLGQQVAKEMKTIPQIYLQGSIQQREELLSGILETCKLKTGTGFIALIINSAKIRNSIIDLVESLGHYCDSSRGPILHIKTREQEQRRTLEKIENIGKRDGVCITVENDSHLYLVDRHIPTHNTKTALEILKDRDCKRILIITGVSNLQEEWLKDAKKHLATEKSSFADYLNLRIVAGNTGASVAKRIKYLKEQHIGEDRFADLIGIESLRGVPLVQAINDLAYDAIVLDECQSAKGMKAEQSLGVHEIEHREGLIRLALSGTPVLNDLLEYYSVLRFLGVIYYKSKQVQCSRSAFNNYYGIWETDFWGARTCIGYKNLDQLHELIDPILLYAPKSLLNLPAKNRHIIDLKIQHPEYRELMALYREGTTAVKRAGYRTIQELASKIKFITSTDQSKKDFVLSKISKRPLVFSQHTTILDDWQEYLTDLGYKVLYYHGKLSMLQRLEILERWKSGEGDILLLSLMCSRYGLNLQETQTAIFLEVPTSPEILEQAEDRLHRIGQQLEVDSFILLAGAWDKREWRRLEKKRIALQLPSEEE